MASNRTPEPAVLFEQLQRFKTEVESVRACQERIRELAELLEALMPNLQASASKGKRGRRERTVDAAELNRLVHNTPEQTEIEQQRAQRQKHEGDARRVRGLIVQLWRKTADRDPGQLEHFLRFEELPPMPEPADLDAVIRSVEGLALESTLPAAEAGAELEVASPATPEGQGAAESDIRPPVSKESLAASRKQLLDDVREATGQTATSVYRAAKVHKGDFYRWLSGRLSTQSKMTKRIEDQLRKLIKSTTLT